MQYHLPADTYKDWARNETRDFVPDERQKLVIEAVRRATEDEKLFYTKDVYAFCVKLLLPNIEDMEKCVKTVEGGEVGMDLYYARKYLDARKRFAREDQAAEQLRPQPGMKLGTLVLQDLKRYTGAAITKVEGDAITVEAKCGSLGYRFVTSPVGLRHAMDRACERKLRKSSFSDFCSGLLAPVKAPQPAAVQGDCASLF